MQTSVWIGGGVVGLIVGTLERVYEKNMSVKQGWVVIAIYCRGGSFAN